MDNETSGSSARSHSTQQHTLRPCINCRDRHLRCDYESEICQRCQKDGKTCSRVHPKYKFRRSQRPKLQNCFSEDQPWVSTTSSLEYVDETTGIIAAHGRTDRPVGEETEVAYDFLPRKDDSTLSSAVSCSVVPPLVKESLPTVQHGTDLRSSVEESIVSPHPRTIQQSASDDACPTTEALSIWYSQTPHTEFVAEDHSSSNGKHYEFDPSSNATEQLFPNFERAVLLRYFVEELSPWFDICDPERHFGQVVPRRARSSKALLNAICTASARHLSRLQRYRDLEGKLEWNGIQLPNITQDTALEYHNECIRDLLRFSLDPGQLQNVNLLAASIILRSDEEMYTSSQQAKASNEVFLRVTGVFIDAQTPSVAAVPYSSPSANQAMTTADGESFATPCGYSPVANNRNLVEIQDVTSASSHSAISPFVLSSNPHSEGLRQACFWIALRQELFASLIDQRAFNFELSKFNSFRNLSRASDAVWADRVVVFHAAVLEYCYNLPADGAQRTARWPELNQELKDLAQQLPSSFRPIHISDRSLNSGQRFPEMWYLENYHVTAAAYLELTKILLVSFNPGRPRFGSGYLASQKRVMRVSRQACMNLCGMALSNQQAPPIHLNACAAVGLCGEYFQESSEREALIWFLRTTEQNIGYPTADLTTILTEAWNSS